MEAVDVHAHIAPRGFLDRAPEDRGQRGISVRHDGATGVYTLVFRGTEVGATAEHTYPIIPSEYNVALRRTRMAEQGVNVQILSANPLLFHYGAEPAEAERQCRLLNEELARIGEDDPEHFVPVAMVPLQDVERACRELERAVRELGMKGVQIGANIWGRDLDDPALYPFYRKAVELNVPILVHPAVSQSHPTAVASMQRLGKYYLRNVIGNLLDTTIAVARIIYSALLEQLPGLRLCFVHGGGYAPYGVGRMDRGYHVREETRGAVPRPPSYYIRQMYFDTVTHDARALRHLLERVGGERVVLGSDYPYDMGLDDPVGFVKGAGLDKELVENVLAGNAARLFGLSE